MSLRRHKTSETGNVLFLILIAVALFAALSYVVTQSNRGGGGITQEKAKLIASQQLQKIQEIQTTILRLQFQGFEQIYFDMTPINYAGTCYQGASTRSPCKTIGIFHGTNGVGLPMVDEASIPADPEFRFWSYWGINSGSLRVNGATLLTDAPDIWLEIWPVQPEVCYEINRRWRGDAAPAPDPTSYNHPLGSMSSGFDVTPPVVTITQGTGVSSSSKDIPGTQFCSGEPDWGHTIYYVLQER